MSKKLPIIVLLCAMIFIPSVAMAQNVFAKQKVVIWNIIDRNDMGFDSGLKNAILQGFRDALVGSEHYEVYEVNIDDIKNSLTAKGQDHNSLNICKIIGEKSDFILFTEIESGFSAFGAQSQNTKVNISCSLYRIKTASKVASDQESTIPDRNAILSATSLLLSRMLGIKTEPQSQHTYQQVGYQQSAPRTYLRKRNSVETILGYLKIFPNELGTFSSVPTSTIQQINNQHLHDYDTWRIPTEEELGLLRGNGYITEDAYISKSNTSVSGRVILVTEAKETYSQRIARETREIDVRDSGKGLNGVYKIGYYYDDGTKKGVVFEVSKDGRHGKIVSLWSAPAQWTSDYDEIDELHGSLKETRGDDNMSFMKSVYGFEKFPAFAICEGKGWYLPAIEELESVYKVEDLLDKVLSQKGSVIGGHSHWSSTEYGYKDTSGKYPAYAVSGSGKRYSSSKYVKLYVRAVSTF